MSETLARRFAEGEALVSGWVSMPEPLVGELCAKAGFDAVTIDMQHGLVDLAAAFRLVSAVRLAGSRAVVRIPVGENQTASRLLDAGADMVIAPMIETVEDARTFGAFMKYPPLGSRSWGPTRALQLDGGGSAYGAPAEDYRKSANGRSLAFAMIETRRALEALDDILALAEIDGVFVGPSDLSVALTDGAELSVDSPENLAAIGRIVKRARHFGKPAGIYAGSGGHARRYLAMGFRFVTLMSDIGYITTGARHLLNEARG